MAAANGWNWFSRPKSVDNDGKTGLTFTDVIFGLVITQVFTQALHYRELRAEVFVHLALALTVVIGSYIGYRRSTKRGELTIFFVSLPLFRFIADLAMIFCYYLLAATPDLSMHAEKVHVSSRFDATVVAVIFGLYVLWDLLSAGMKRAGYAIHHGWLRTFITVSFLAVSSVVTWLAYEQPRTSEWAIVVDALLIATTIAYRWIKDAAPAA